MAGRAMSENNERIREIEMELDKLLRTMSEAPRAEWLSFRQDIRSLGKKLFRLTGSAKAMLQVCYRVADMDSPNSGQRISRMRIHAGFASGNR
jgi:hypothetical protein